MLRYIFYACCTPLAMLYRYAPVAAHRWPCYIATHRLLHTAGACATSTALGKSNHAGPLGHVRSEQSEPVHPFTHVHAYVGTPPGPAMEPLRRGGDTVEAETEVLGQICSSEVRKKY